MKFLIQYKTYNRTNNPRNSFGCILNTFTFFQIHGPSYMSKLHCVFNQLYALFSIEVEILSVTFHTRLVSVCYDCFGSCFQKIQVRFNHCIRICCIESVENELSIGIFILFIYFFFSFYLALQRGSPSTLFPTWTVNCVANPPSITRTLLRTISAKTTVNLF